MTAPADRYTLLPPQTLLNFCQETQKPPFPVQCGLYGKPTTINNTETFASVPAIIRNGSEWFLNIGKANKIKLPSKMHSRHGLACED